MVALALVVDSVQRPEAPRAVVAPAEEREKHRVRRHPLLLRRTRHPVAHPHGPEREVDVVHQGDVRMVPVDREKPPVVLSAFLCTRRDVSVEPQRQHVKLPSAVVLFLVVHEQEKSPPVAVRGEDRPENVVRLPLVRVERPYCEKVVGGPLFVERPDLERDRKQKAT